MCALSLLDRLATGPFPIDETTAESAAALQTILYDNISAAELLRRQHEPFEPVMNDSRYRSFCFMADDGQIAAVGHLRLRHNKDSQGTRRIVRHGDVYRLESFAETYESDAHELEIGGAAVHPEFSGNGIGKRLMRHLTEIALDTPFVVTRTAKGIYQTEQMERLIQHIHEFGLAHASELLPYGVDTLPKNQDASKSSVQIAHEFNMIYAGISPTFGGPFFYLPVERER